MFIYTFNPIKDNFLFILICVLHTHLLEFYCSCVVYILFRVILIEVSACLFSCDWIRFEIDVVCFFVVASFFGQRTRFLQEIGFKCLLSRVPLTCIVFCNPFAVRETLQSLQTLKRDPFSTEFIFEIIAHLLNFCSKNL